MSVFNYSRYKIVIDPQSKKTQGLQVGDVVRRQYRDGNSVIYSLMVVLETGVDMIQGKDSSYFIGALLEGEEPKNGELLDFVRVTNLFNRDRSGALYLTASDSEAPYLDVIDGLAVEKSLCYPYTLGGDPEKASRNQYACLGERYLIPEYVEDDLGANRIFRVTRNSAVGSAILGIKQTLEECPGHPARLLISYKIRGAKAGKGIPVSFGYTDGKQMDGRDQVDVDVVWRYCLHVVTIDFPESYRRSFTVDLSSVLVRSGDWVEVADLNIVELAHVANFAEGSKVRVGKITGVVDPVFGVLDGYGAYFQNLYATRNVNIAGTLTAGDKDGASSTFYVGRIHKNVIQNSIDCAFENDMSVILEKSPVGIGSVWRMDSEIKLVAQSAAWRKEHVGEMYCFSFWVKSAEDVGLYLCQDDAYAIGDVKVVAAGGDWRRYWVSFPIRDSKENDLCLYIRGGKSAMRLSAPQLEAGDSPSQYQPTDERLSYTKEYGAWFSQGGIGGTIQNPLLKLNEDGSISARDGSFVIRKDGTGYFADGRFEWSKDEIVLRDVTIKWKDLDDEGKENLLPVTVEIRSNSGLVVKNEDRDVDVRAVLFRNGEEIDVDGRGFEYRWKLWDAAGKKVLREYSGKEVVVLKGEFEDKGVLSYEIVE